MKWLISECKIKNRVVYVSNVRLDFLVDIIRVLGTIVHSDVAKARVSLGC